MSPVIAFDIAVIAQKVEVQCCYIIRNSRTDRPIKEFEEVIVLVTNRHFIVISFFQNSPSSLSTWFVEIR